MEGYLLIEPNVSYSEDRTVETIDVRFGLVSVSHIDGVISSKVVFVASVVQVVAIGESFLEG